MLDTVFVYGTLKQGFSNHGWATEAAAPAITPATLEGFAMYDLGAFPGIRPQLGSTVQGELLTYPADAMPEVLTLLDRLEGYRGAGRDNMYDREQHAVTLPDGQTVPAWAYVYARSLSSAAHLPQGVWE